jgi:hypothetical protein
MFSYEAASSQNGNVQVTLRNEIESPLSIQTLDATITRDGRRVRGLIQGTSLPRERLLPGETMQLALSPEAPIDAGSQPEVTFDLSGVAVIPDPEAIWNSILDRSTLEYFKIVTVKAIPTLFNAVVGREAEVILSILIEFESGGTAELNADSLEAHVRVDYPIDDVILGHAITASYRYTVTVIRKNGQQDRDPLPRSQSADVFYVSVIK